MATIKSWIENIKQINYSPCIMYVMYVMWMVAFLASVSSKTTGTQTGTDVVTEILSAISGREDTRRVADYLNLSRAELVKEMPLFSPDGTKLSYTFFAPTSFAFLLQTPQDTVDPFLVDANLRLRVLIRHFARQGVSSNDLTRLDTLVMADSSVAAITRTADTKTFINGAEIQSSLSSSFVAVYIVDRVFIVGNEINDAISAHFQNNPATIIGLPEMLPSVVPEIAIVEPSVSALVPTVGGFSSVSPNDIDVQDVARFVTTSLSANGASPLFLVSVDTAEKQIVAGVNYRLQLKFNNQLESEENTLIVCQVVVFDQPWTSTRQISSSKCSLSRSATSVEID
ncbi:uncharacterized protein LOC130699318 [Daphnia carinata]|uniref:uncharacterized protein LOC130699318 n=1 Tax=Daphnia carinata TaxID=120202 RepID=UPI00257CAB91|nr:uncharacterized protein LOC130699318 [Daphnia carinata]